MKVFQLNVAGFEFCRQLVDYRTNGENILGDVTRSNDSHTERCKRYAHPEPVSPYYYPNRLLVKRQTAAEVMLTLTAANISGAATVCG
jgi:hypothetical protein